MESVRPEHTADEAHAKIELLVPVSLHRRLREDPELRKMLVQYANEQMSREDLRNKAATP